MSGERDIVLPDSIGENETQPDQQSDHNLMIRSERMSQMKEILVVVDMQKDFIDGALGTKEAMAIVPAAAQKIRDFEGPVFVTLDTHDDNYPETAEGKKLPVKHCIKGTLGHELNEEIRKALSGKNCTITEKLTFGSVRLPGLIQENGTPDSITLIGLCTDICVISNALILKAFFPETEINVDSTCCAGVTPELHQAALAAMNSCQINIL